MTFSLPKDVPFRDGSNGVLWEAPPARIISNQCRLSFMARPDAEAPGIIITMFGPFSKVPNRNKAVRNSESCCAHCHTMRRDAAGLRSVWASARMMADANVSAAAAIFAGLSGSWQSSIFRVPSPSEEEGIGATSIFSGECASRDQVYPVRHIFAGYGQFKKLGLGCHVLCSPFHGGLGSQTQSFDGLPHRAARKTNLLGNNNWLFATGTVVGDSEIPGQRDVISQPTKNLT